MDSVFLQRAHIELDQQLSEKNTNMHFFPLSYLGYFIRVLLDYKKNLKHYKILHYNMTL